MTPDPTCADVVIVGAGPAGLAAAIALRRHGVRNVVVLERESEGGGVPRHCAHSPFGLREFARVLSGPAYARRLVAAAQAAGARLALGSTVVAIETALGRAVELTVADETGLRRIAARRVILATGIREETRAARLVPGDRPLGILNTGALQAHAHLERSIPFERPVIVGTELVALSALLTLRAIGVKPVAMIEDNSEATVRGAFMALPMLLGVPIHTGARIVDIRGRPRVEAVTIRKADGALQDIACDGVLFTGRFVPEASLARVGGIAIDPASRGPAIDQFGRTDDPRIFAAGNLLRGVETAGWCHAEGRAVAGFVADDLASGLPPPQDAAIVEPGEAVRYVVPQRVVRVAPFGKRGAIGLQLRVDRPVEGRLVARCGDAIVGSRRLAARPEHRILMSIDADPATSQTIVVGIEGTALAARQGPVDHP